MSTAVDRHMAACAGVVILTYLPVLAHSDEGNDIPLSHHSTPVVFQHHDRFT